MRLEGPLGEAVISSVLDEDDGAATWVLGVEDRRALGDDIEF
jgi:hypothetical protein